MKASEFIKMLQEEIEKHGDRVLMVYDNEQGGNYHIEEIVKEKDTTCCNTTTGEYKEEDIFSLR